MIEGRKYEPFNLALDTPPLQARQFVVGRYERFVDDTDLTIPQKSVFKTQFERIALLIDRDFIPEEEARARGEPHANIPYHSRRHFWQTAHDDINVAYVLADRGLVPMYLAMELPQDGLGHDWGYMGRLNEKYPSYAHRILIHVEHSTRKLVRLRQEPGYPSFYTDREKEMSHWKTILATHATHFRDPQTMARLLRDREKITDRFVDKFAGESDREYWTTAAQWIVDGARFADLGGQIAQIAYMQVLPGLRFELNEATPKGEPLKGDTHIGITPELMIKNGSGFVQFFILNGRPFLTAQTLFGPDNAYEQAWKKLIVP